MRYRRGLRRACQRTGLFYHLCQSTWRKIQELGGQLGVVGEYTSRDDVKLCWRAYIEALAFLPVADVDAGTDYLFGHVSDCDGLTGPSRIFRCNEQSTALRG